MADASPGFFSNLMGGIGGLLGLKDAPPDPNAQRPDESVVDYATRRQNARFGVMKQEVDGLLKKYPAIGDFPADFSEERRGLRQRGFDQKEEDAIIHTFAGEFGKRSGNLNFALSGGKEEWQPQDIPGKGGAPGYATTEPAGPGPSRDLDVEQKLIDNWTKSGREPSYVMGKTKRGRGTMFRDSAPGFDT